MLLISRAGAYDPELVDNNERLISELSRVLSRRGLSVRSEPLWGVHPGGKCRLKGKLVVLLNTKSPPMERLIVLADCVAEAPVEGEELSIEAHALLQRRVAPTCSRPPTRLAPVWRKARARRASSAASDCSVRRRPLC
jgi:hypothetical protein